MQLLLFVFIKPADIKKKTVFNQTTKKYSKIDLERIK